MSNEPSRNFRSDAKSTKTIEAEAEEETLEETELKFIDIGANLLDPMYSGIYRSKERHPPDLSIVLNRAWSHGLDRIILTGGSLQESQQVLNMARRPTSDDNNNNSSSHRMFCTVGVHPTRCSEFGSTSQEYETHIQQLTNLVKDGMSDGTVVAIGELGLDYARTQFCDVETQIRGFEAQLQIAKPTGLPLFLHNRGTGSDLLNILKQHWNELRKEEEGGGGGGVVHSFDDTSELAKEFLDLGLYIGINGCSLKTHENLNVIRNDIPLNRLLLETDCPWCDIRATHAGYEYIQTTFVTKKEKQYEQESCVKGRNEPCHIVQVAEIIAAVKGCSVKDVADASRKNAFDLFGPLEKKKK